MIPGRAAIFAHVGRRNNKSKQAVFSILLFSVERRSSDDKWELFQPALSSEPPGIEHESQPSFRWIFLDASCFRSCPQIEK